MKHYLLVNWHQMHLPGIRDLIENLKNDERFEVSHWNSKSFVDPKKTEYKSYSLIGNFQKLDSRSFLPMNMEDLELIRTWKGLKKPRAWISSFIDLHLGIDKMLFGKNTSSILNGESMLVEFFDSVVWSYEHNSFDFTIGNNEKNLWENKRYNSYLANSFIRKNFKSRLDFPWAIFYPDINFNSKKKYDFCIPGAGYPKRKEVHEILKENFKIAPYIFFEGLIIRSTSIPSKLIPRICNKTFIGKLREVNMKKCIKTSKYAYVDGSVLQYFVRKNLEVIALGTTMICPETNPLTMYGFKKNIHYIEINEFLLDPNKFVEQFNEIKLRHEDVTKLIYKNHTFKVRIQQLYEFLEGLLNNDYFYGAFKNGTFSFQTINAEEIEK